jgi:hypothetical protein
MIDAYQARNIKSCDNLTRKKMFEILSWVPEGFNTVPTRIF